jgi:hypothetical protein
LQIYTNLAEIHDGCIFRIEVKALGVQECECADTSVVTQILEKGKED